MKDLKYFNQLNDYTANKDSFKYPTVSYVEENTNVYYMEKPEVRILTYTTTGDSQQVKLVNKQEYLDYIKIVETGEELPVTGTGELNYTFTDAGEHEAEIKFKDDATTLASGFSGCSKLTSVPTNLFSNCTAVTDFSETFLNCSGLTSIPENLFSNNTDVTTFYTTFAYCTGLTGSIPDNLFSNNTAVTDFSYTFYGCSGLTSIPANLFSNNTSVTNFEYTFRYCKGLTGSITANLFQYNTAVTDFSYTFQDCSGLTNIPENLFSNCTAVTSFNATFSNCSGLTSIPENLFKYNTAVTSFEWTFAYCHGLTGNVPVDSDGTPIYNRSGLGKEGYSVVTDYENCFTNCTGLTDYDSIPSRWK